jgi:hypothetical protein
MPVALIEAGSSHRMFSDLITDKSHPIECLGNGEYRAYFDDEVKNGRVRKSSPAYFASTKKDSKPLDYRGVRVGYNSGELIRDIDKVHHDYCEVHIETTWVSESGVLNLVTERPHGLLVGEYITIGNSSNGGLLNGSHEVISCTDSIFSIKFEGGSSSPRGITADFESLYGSKVYCNVKDFSAGDLVVFDYASGGGKTHMIIDINIDEHGVYFLIGGLLPKFAKKVVKSHSETKTEDLVEFGYENHLSYYQVAKLNTQSDSMWLTYEPDLLPRGRAGSKVSFIQFFHKGMNVYD